MQKKLAVIIDLNESQADLGDLTKTRPVGSLPFAGKYRLIDFPLSAAMHADVNKVLLTLPQRCQSVLDHVRNGREWHMNTVGGGLFISMHDERQQIVDVFRFVRHAGVPQIAVMGTSEVMNLDLGVMSGVHERQSQPITLAYQWRKRTEVTPETAVLVLDEAGRARDVKLAKEVTLAEHVPVYLNAGIFDTKVVTDSLSRALQEGEPETVRGVLRQTIQEFGANTMLFERTALPVHDVPSYFASNKHALEYKVYMDLFNEREIHTKAKNEAPAHFTVSSDVRHSMLGVGGHYAGTIADSVLFRGVDVQDDAVIEDSVIMQECVIGRDAKLSHVILDKGVTIGDNVELAGTPERPLVIGKGEVIVCGDEQVRA